MAKPAVLLAVLLVVIADAEQAAFSFQKKVREELVYSDRGFHPRTLQQLWARSDLVIVGKIVDSLPADAAFPELGIVTKFRVRISDVLKADRRVKGIGSSVDVLRLGGSREEKDDILTLREIDFEQFEMGKRYVLFLKWHNATNAYDPAAGPDAVYKVNSGLIFSTGRSRLGSMQKGKEVDEFLSALRVLR